MATPSQALMALERAVKLRDWDALARAIWQLKQDPTAVPILSQQLLEEWHESHEDIVFELGLIGDPRAIPAISEAATIPFENLVKSDNLREFQRKCAYALARIGTQESRVALEALARHSDPKLSEYGKEGLAKWPLPYRR